MNEQPAGSGSALLDLMPEEDDLLQSERFLNDQGEPVIFLNETR